MIKSFLGQIYFDLLKLHRLVAKNRYRSPSFVISVGNLSVGGTGKTPFCIYITKQLSKSASVCVVTRSYKSSLKKPALVGKDWELFGDEAVLMSQQLSGVTVASGPVKWKTAKWLSQQERCDVTIIDDGFQHWALARNFDIVLIDATQPYDGLLPLGRFREPFSSLLRADVVVLTKTNFVNSETLQLLINRLKPYCKNIVQFESVTKLDSSTLANAKPAQSPVKVLLVTGVARPDNVRRSVDLIHSIEVVEHITFPDHHVYKSSDFQRIREEMQAVGAEKLLTTQKDHVKFDQSWADVIVLDHEMRPVSELDQEQLLQLIANKLKDFV